MPSDASIYGQIQPIRSPLEQQQQVLQLRAMMESGQLNALTLQEKQREIAEAAKLRELFGRGNVTPEEIMAINPQTGLAYQRNKLEREKSQAELDRIKAETFLKNMTIHRDMLAGVNDQAGWDAWREVGARLFGPDGARRVPPQFSPQLKEQMLLKAEDLIVPLAKKLELGGQERGRTETQRHNLAQENRPQWDAERGIWVTPPRQGPQTAPFASAPSAPQAAPPIAQPGAVPGAAPAAAPAPILPKAEMERQAKEKEKAAELKKSLNLYVASRDGLLSGLSGTETGPMVGRIPAMTAGQQTADGGVAAMVPALKQLFRSAGEGTFSDRDQQSLLDMVPTRTDHPAARREKMANIDRIVAAKLGMEVPAPKIRAPKPASKGGPRVNPSSLSDDELRRELGL